MKEKIINTIERVVELTNTVNNTTLDHVEFIVPLNVDNLQHIENLIITKVADDELKDTVLDYTFAEVSLRGIKVKIIGSKNVSLDYSDILIVPRNTVGHINLNHYIGGAK